MAQAERRLFAYYPSEFSVAVLTYAGDKQADVARFGKIEKVRETLVTTDASAERLDPLSPTIASVASSGTRF